jgi:hypothetical protein
MRIADEYGHTVQDSVYAAMTSFLKLAGKRNSGWVDPAAESFQHSFYLRFIEQSLAHLHQPIMIGSGCSGGEGLGGGVFEHGDGGGRGRRIRVRGS